MSAVTYRFVEPLDVLFLRGNKLFGDPGSFGESLVPPWPSVVAGALRSRMLADDGVDPSAFANGQVEHPALGTPQNPGPFSITAFHLARRTEDGRTEALFASPADLVITKTESGRLDIRALAPISRGEGPATGSGVVCSYPDLLPILPVLRQSKRSKPESGYWLTEAGWRKYLQAVIPTEGDIVDSIQLWCIDSRVGVGLDSVMRRALDGRLFSMQAVAMAKREQCAGNVGCDVGFLVGVVGAKPPSSGTVRLGGDGRAAAVAEAQTTLPEPDYEAIAQARRCRMVLTTPGLFPGGWLPTGCVPAADGMLRFELQGGRARLACAAVPRAEVISGWDLANVKPKPALRAASVGSVYWLDELDATPDDLRNLVQRGLWNGSWQDTLRRAEGFNRFTLATY